MRICIDAGHNYTGFDTGASGNGLKEQEVTFKIADRLKMLLLGAGIDVTMTRAKMTDNVGKNAKDAINERARLANSTKCDYFVSIHCNAGGGTGTETLIYGIGGKAEPLAKCVNNEIVNHFGLKDRGVKVRTDLGVLRLTDMPAILVETAFIDNKNDALLLKNKADEFAKAIFDGIVEFFGVGFVQKNEIEEIIDVISEMVEINNKEAAVSALGAAKKENTSLYWILKKIAVKAGKGESA